MYEVLNFDGLILRRFPCTPEGKHSGRQRGKDLTMETRLDRESELLSPLVCPY